MDAKKLLISPGGTLFTSKTFMSRDIELIPEECKTRFINNAGSNAGHRH
jgi:hypothetical protein